MNEEDKKEQERLKNRLKKEIERTRNALIKETLFKLWGWFITVEELIPEKKQDELFDEILTQEEKAVIQWVRKNGKIQRLRNS
jgi:hypothetical protein